MLNFQDPANAAIQPQTFAQTFLARAIELVTDKSKIGIIIINSFDQVQSINKSAGRILRPLADTKEFQNSIDLFIIKRLLPVALAQDPDFNAADEFPFKMTLMPVQIADQTLRLIFLNDPAENIDVILQEFRITQKREYLLNKALELVFEHFGVVDKQGQLVYISQKTCNSIKMWKENALGHHVNKVLPDCALAGVARTGKPKLAFIYQFDKRPVPAIELPINKNGETIGAVCATIFKDVSDATRYLKTIDAKNKKKGNKGLLKIRDVKYSFSDIVGKDREIAQVKDLAYKISRGDSPVLITGESGVGKEMFALSIHAASSRVKGPFIRVNCAGIPENLLESELFGYEAGAFSGALKEGKPGKFELAHGGSIFLDETGDMSPNMQAKLLRVLQEGEIDRVGGAEALEVDVRVIAATNKNLLQMIKQGGFREDLFYRLSVISLNIPPLRQWKKDIPELIDHFLGKLNFRQGTVVRGVTPETLEALQRYSWPGNVRELENILESALYFCRKGRIRSSDLPTHFWQRLDQEDENFLMNKTRPVAKNKIFNDEYKAMYRALKSCNGNKKQAAKLIGMPRSTFYYKLNTLKNRS